MPTSEACTPDGHCRLLITAGPTHEPIDSVRYLANRSSGRMGLALAEAATERRIPTTLLLGPISIEPPQSSHLTTLRFRTTADLQALLAEHWPGHDVLIMAAAVADYRPIQTDKPEKIRRSNEKLTLELEPTQDLLAWLTRSTRPDQTVIGFALEPEADLKKAARGKLERKRLDAIVANPLKTMDSQRIAASVILRSGQILDPPSAGEIDKSAFADWLLDQLPAIRSLPRR